jgi:hypothetical protein
MLEHAPAFAQVREPGRRFLRRVARDIRYSRGSGSNVSMIAGRPAWAASAQALRDQRPMPEVDSIEAADRDGGSPMMGLQPL